MVNDFIWAAGPPLREMEMVASGNTGSGGGGAGRMALGIVAGGSSSSSSSSSNDNSSLSSRSSPGGAAAATTTDQDCTEGESTYDPQWAEMEAWLDEHPEFANEYFIR